jgi:uncharacterized protein
LRRIDEAELEDIALGAGILGTGGGGDPYVGKLLARETMREFGAVELVGFDELDDDDLVLPVAMMGAPTVMVEKLPAGDEVLNAFRTLERRLGRPAAATIPIEIGGINSMIPISLAAQARVPVVDGDFMGRAFPELQMCLPGIFGRSASPMAIADDKGNTSTIEAIDNLWTERMARSLTIDMGCAALIALYPATVREMRECTITGSMTMARDLGALVRETRAAHADPIDAIAQRLRGYRIFEGKVVDVHRRTEGGFARAEVSIEGIGDDAGSTLWLYSQNEHLIAQRDGELIASVPDLIVVLESDTGQPIMTEDMRYGYRTSVLAVPCDERWRTPAGLAVVGPRYFGYGFDYLPIEQRVGGA